MLLFIGSKAPDVASYRQHTPQLLPVIGSITPNCCRFQALKRPVVVTCRHLKTALLPLIGRRATTCCQF